jgi:hypothetical protein
VFTEGNWTAEPIGSRHKSVQERGMAYRIRSPHVESDRRAIAVVYYKPDEHEADDNARLIVAAKKMYETLQAIDEESDRLLHAYRRSNPEYNPEWFEKLKAVMELIGPQHKI